MYNKNMKKDGVINIRVSNELKKDFDEAVRSEGFSMSEVIEAMMKDTVESNNIQYDFRKYLTPSKNKILTIPEIKHAFSSVFSKYEWVKRASVIGSYAIGSAKSDSEVTIYLELENYGSGFAYYGMLDEIRKALKKEIEILTEPRPPYTSSMINDSKIVLYESKKIKKIQKLVEESIGERQKGSKDYSLEESKKEIQKILNSKQKRTR